MRVQFLGAARTVTGSCYLLEVGQTKIMVDCGMFQGSKEIKERNYESFYVEPNEVKFLLLTHAHIDHSGLIPKLYKHGFRGQILATSATVDLCSILLPDSAHVQEMEVERKNRKLKRAGKPLLEEIYTVQDAMECLKQFRRVEYQEVIQLTPEVSVRFQDAGHILGSAMIEMWVQEGDHEIKLVFSGDIGNHNQPLVKDPTLIEAADYVFMESTYGNRLHQENVNKVEALKNVILETMAKGGNLIIPAFAVERTQDLLYDLNLLLQTKSIPNVPVIIDSPLAIEATEIFRRNSQYFDAETQELIRRGENPLALPGLRYTHTAEESKALNGLKGGAIIISASGMCDAGRIKHHLRHNLWRPESTVLFVGYQAKGTLGRRLLDGEKLVTIHGEEVVVKADIRNIDGFSAHADQRALLAWVKRFRSKPGKIFIVHGEEESSLTLAQLITQEMGIPTVVPKWLDVEELTPLAVPVAAPVAVAQPAPTTVPPKMPAGVSVALATQVEHAYFELRMKLRELVEQEMDQQNFESLLAKIQQLEQLVDQWRKIN
ncbi:MAG: MBL fold metallo-hydrolase [Firmicutes bacterium]|nr:MBL fold metallo-hydrolase [Bacillota bacterium]